MRSALLLGGWVLLTLFPTRVRAANSVSLPLAKIPDLANKGGGAIIKLKDRALLLIRVDDKVIHAFDPTCTHEKCQVLYDSSWGEIRCKCHGSKFTLDGKVTGPPAKANLGAYETKIEGDRLVVDLTLITPP